MMFAEVAEASLDLRGRFRAGFGVDNEEWRHYWAWCPLTGCSQFENRETLLT
jgi:hypothetical protein